MSNSSSLTGPLSNHLDKPSLHSPCFHFSVPSNPWNFWMFVLRAVIPVQNTHLTEVSEKMYLSLLVEYCKRNYSVIESFFAKNFKWIFNIFFVAPPYLWFKVVHTSLTFFPLLCSSIFPSRKVTLCALNIRQQSHLHQQFLEQTQWFRLNSASSQVQLE